MTSTILFDYCWVRFFSHGNDWFSPLCCFLYSAIPICVVTIFSLSLLIYIHPYIYLLFCVGFISFTDAKDFEVLKDLIHEQPTQQHIPFVVSRMFSQIVSSKGSQEVGMDDIQLFLLIFVIVDQLYIHYCCCYDNVIITTIITTITVDCISFSLQYGNNRNWLYEIVSIDRFQVSKRIGSSIRPTTQGTSLVCLTSLPLSSQSSTTSPFILP